MEESPANTGARSISDGPFSNKRTSTEVTVISRIKIEIFLLMVVNYPFSNIFLQPGLFTADVLTFILNKIIDPEAVCDEILPVILFIFNSR